MSHHVDDAVDVNDVPGLLRSKSARSCVALRWNGACCSWLKLFHSSPSAALQATDGNVEGQRQISVTKSAGARTIWVTHLTSAGLGPDFLEDCLRLLFLVTTSPLPSAPGIRTLVLHWAICIRLHRANIWRRQHVE